MKNVFIFAFLLCAGVSYGQMYSKCRGCDDAKLATVSVPELPMDADIPLGVKFAAMDANGVWHGFFDNFIMFHFGVGRWISTGTDSIVVAKAKPSELWYKTLTKITNNETN
jgi:hypothetical protein